MELIAAILHDITLIFIGNVFGQRRYLPFLGIIVLITAVVLIVLVYIYNSTLFLLKTGVLLQRDCFPSVFLSILTQV